LSKTEFYIVIQTGVWLKTMLYFNVDFMRTHFYYDLIWERPSPLAQNDA